MAAKRTTKKTTKSAVKPIPTAQPEAPEEKQPAAVAPDAPASEEPTTPEVVPQADPEPPAPVVDPEPVTAPVVETAQTRVHRLTARAKAHLRAIMIPHIKPDVVDANMARIVDHVELGMCAVVTSNPVGVDLLPVAQSDMSREELVKRYGPRLRFDVLTTLRKAQVL